MEPVGFRTGRFEKLPEEDAIGSEFIKVEFHI